MSGVGVVGPARAKHVFHVHGADGAVRAVLRKRPRSRQRPCFPGTKAGRSLSDMTLSRLLKELGSDTDVPRFGAGAREQTNLAREVAEFALAHVVGDAAERAYARSDLFERRREVMDAWAADLAEKRSSRGSVAVAWCQPGKPD